jgi:hypothetical protein
MSTVSRVLDGSAFCTPVTAESPSTINNDVSALGIPASGASKSIAELSFFPDEHVHSSLMRFASGLSI